MSLRLVSIDPWSPSVAFEIERLPSMIGSNGGSDFLIENRWTANRHCEIKQLNGSLMVRAVGRKTEILVNGRAVRKAKLHDGDELTIGIRVLRVEHQDGIHEKNGETTTDFRKEPTDSLELVTR